MQRPVIFSEGNFVWGLHFCSWKECCRIQGIYTQFNLGNHMFSNRYHSWIWKRGGMTSYWVRRKIAQTLKGKFYPWDMLLYLRIYQCHCKLARVEACPPIIAAWTPAQLHKEKAEAWCGREKEGKGGAVMHHILNQQFSTTVLRHIGLPWRCYEILGEISGLLIGGFQPSSCSMVYTLSMVNKLMVYLDKF